MTIKDAEAKIEALENDKTQLVAERDAAISERDAAISERDAARKTLDTVSSSFEASLDNVRAERDAAFHERNEAQARAEQAAQERVPAVLAGPVESADAAEQKVARLKDEMRRYGVKQMWISDDGGEFTDKASALRGVSGVEARLMLITL